MLFAPQGILKIHPWQKLKTFLALFAKQDREEPAEG